MDLSPFLSYFVADRGPPVFILTPALIVLSEG